MLILAAFTFGVFQNLDMLTPVFMSGVPESAVNFGF
jgi:hypothetical protein